MNHVSCPPFAFVPTTAGSRAVVLYEDLPAADQGVAFALSLNVEVGLEIGSTGAQWWLDMAEVPSIAGKIGCDLQASSYVILALSGEDDLSLAKKQWLRQWMTTAHKSAPALIVLFDPERSHPKRVTALQSWLQRHADGSDVNVFFFGAAEAETERACTWGFAGPGEDDDAPEDWSIGPISRFNDDDHRLSAA